MHDPIRILLVANKEESQSIVDALVEAGLSAPRVGHGGDNTIAMATDELPEVVVLCASLEQGDARSLASALRSIDRSIRIVLVGDQYGPIRNALDGADFDVDRFVSRPLSGKALAFAVRTCANELRAEGPTGIADANGMLPNVRKDVSVSGDWDIGPDSPFGGAEVEVEVTPEQVLESVAEENPTVDRAVEEAVHNFVADAMGALDHGWVLDSDKGTDSDEPARAMPLPPAMSAEQGESAEPGENADSSGGDVSTSAVGVDAVPKATVEDVETARVQDPQDVAGWRDPSPEPSWREPTLILSGGGSEVAEVVDPIDITDPQNDSPWDREDSLTGEDHARLVSDLQGIGLELGLSVDDGDVIAEIEGDDQDASGDPFEGDPDDEITETPLEELDLDELDAVSEPTPPRAQTVAQPPPGQAEAPAAASGEDSDSGPNSQEAPKSSAGDIGRELRKKMSLMAERLFPGRAERGPVDVELAHDAHTDIDLTAIGVADEVGIAAPYEQIGSAQTFADTNPLSKLEPTPAADLVMTEDTDDGTARRRSVTGEPPTRGDISDLDVASLFGRLLQSRFGGRVGFRKNDAEKSVHFEDGRPVFAISNLPHDRMGDLLYREGKITREQQMAARELVIESGRRMGEILVEMEFLKPRELLPAVRHHIEDIVYSLFSWEAGDFVLHSGEPPSERIRLTRHPAAIVLEGVRRKYSPERLASGLVLPSATVVIGSQRQLGAITSVVELSASERATLQRLDGERSLEEVAHSVHLDVGEVLQLAYALIALGVAEILDPGGEADLNVPTRSRALVGETDLVIDRQRVLAKYSLVVEADYFTLLGVRRDATSFEIRRAYEAARRDFTSAGFPPELQRELAGELTDIGNLIEEAYQVLRNDRIRRSYQANLMD